MPERTLEIITTHMNADFDGLASMVAAKKLYPNATLVFPGSQERNLRDFFVRSSLYFLNFAKIKDINLEDVKRLILVDTRQAGRIGKFGELFPNGDVDVHVYDHHPDSPDDLAGSVEVVRPVGATVSILTQLIKERGISLTPDEATILALGIYEDTGSFTFSSTTPAEFEAAKFLLEQGANLNTVAEMLTRELTVEQVALLNDLIRNATTLNFSGIEIVVARASASQYVGDFAVLAHKFMDMENIQVLFASGPNGGTGLHRRPQSFGRSQCGGNFGRTWWRGACLCRLGHRQGHSSNPGGGETGQNSYQQCPPPAHCPGYHVVSGDVRGAGHISY